MPHSITETTGPRFNPVQYPSATDLSRVPGGEAIGQRIIVEGSVTDEDGRPVPHTIIDIWQSNSARRQH